MGESRVKRAAFVIVTGAIASIISHISIYAADKIHLITNARIVTVDDRFTLTDAMAFQGDRIIALGEAAKSLDQPGADIVRLDMKGLTILPGLMDSHTHPVAAATHEHDHEIPAIGDIPQLLDYIRGRTMSQPEGSLIAVRQVFVTRLKEQRYPTRVELDSVAPAHPVTFSTGPDTMLNSAALKAAGIDRNYRHPAGMTGLVEFDADGEPTGMVRAFVPKIPAMETTKTPTPAETQAHVESLFADYNKVGFTTIADRGAAPSSIQVYEKMKQTGRLNVRLRVSHTFPSDAPWEESEKAIDAIIAHPLRKPDLMLQIIGTKIWLDGGMLTGSALMIDPWGESEIYGIRDKSYRGVQRTPGKYLEAMIRKVSDAGLQFTAHSVGDGAVKLLVDTYAKLDAEKPIAASRPCVTHCNFMAPESIAKAAKHGVVIDLQPIWFWLDGRTLLKQFGDERMSRFQPLRSMVDAGLKVGGGSDHMQKIGSLRSVNPYDPWLAMWIAESRRSRDLDRPLHPEEGLNRREIIRMYTIENAWVLFLEKEAGSLETGKLADFIVTDREVDRCSVDELRETKVLETWLGGKRLR
jgi:predicted amidohydrolase YtcJ